MSFQNNNLRSVQWTHRTMLDLQLRLLRLWKHLRLKDNRCEIITTATGTNSSSFGIDFVLVWGFWRRNRQQLSSTVVKLDRSETCPAPLLCSSSFHSSRLQLTGKIHAFGLRNSDKNAIAKLSFIETDKDEMLSPLQIRCSHVGCGKVSSSTPSRGW